MSSALDHLNHNNNNNNNNNNNQHQVPFFAMMSNNKGRSFAGQERSVAPDLAAFDFQDEAAVTSVNSTFGQQHIGNDDFFSSPEWTDPSPALTNSLSFDLDSCDPSPLLVDNYEGEAPELAGIPLFGDYRPQHQLDQSDKATVDANDFPLFGSVASSEPQSAPSPTSGKRAQMAFKPLQDSFEDPTAVLLRALSNAARAQTATGDDTTKDATPMTASPAAISSSPPSPFFQPRNESSLESTKSNTTSTVDEAQRGIKRRHRGADLLPLDAPIQPRHYKTPSATSRKASKTSADQQASNQDPFSAEEAALAAEKDPVVAKRLSNTLAARRSRHRKAEELRTLHETIEDLQAEVEMWKSRCQRAEDEREKALGRV
ncbi:hypothetical protein FA10DRAFT_266972 [Acaromyces ingoldii]|uniref:BZIP domain-containing protein n=1 Tax=Acaromyces ingoldii TaxID=215250 RepID=A0A316YML6_9BASI|nr:hypothetical protein FA10DRAFT_266972 [Acaromyces ingoldii]PWN90499.1 hypothetical protein FA10DRAFT_266972 [Acaromyces ingoldii]